MNHKKANEWQRARRIKIKELVATGEYTTEGRYLIGACVRCTRFMLLDLHHKEGRRGANANDPDNLEPICRECHWIEHGVIMAAETKRKKKPNWATDHKCQYCKAIVTTLICSNCQKLSVKVE